jgi:hydrogenase small subunit
VWPIGIGHPCFGCTEKEVGFTKAMHATADLGPDAYPAIEVEHGTKSAAWAGVAGLVGGAIVGAGLAASKKLGEQED